MSAAWCVCLSRIRNSFHIMLYSIFFVYAAFLLLSIPLHVMVSSSQHHASLYATCSIVILVAMLDSVHMYAFGHLQGHHTSLRMHQYHRIYLMYLKMLTMCVTLVDYS